jgi:hypothetical protein
MPARALILFPILALAARAQPPPFSWENVKMLAPGTQIRVASAASKGIVGTLASVSDSELLLMQKTGPQSFPRPQIVSVSVRKERHRLRNALIGMGVGLVAGAGLSVVVSEAERNCTFLCGLVGPADAVLGGAAGLVGGGLLGAFWPSGWREIYAP